MSAAGCMGRWDVPAFQISRALILVRFIRLWYTADTPKQCGRRDKCGQVFGGLVGERQSQLDADCLLLN